MITNNILAWLWPQGHNQYRKLPLFGEIVEEFAQWSLQQGFDRKTIRCDLWSLQRLVPWFQRRGKRSLAELSATDVDQARAYYRLRDAHRATAIRKLGHFLEVQGRLQCQQIEPPKPSELVLDDYTAYLRDECGSAEATIENRRYHLLQFLRFLRFGHKTTSLKGLKLVAVERFLVHSARRYCRQSMPIVVATMRSFLRFQHLRGVLRSPLHEQIETVRQYQGEQLPRAASWPKVQELLNKPDRSNPLECRDYAILLLAATYGLRRSEVVVLTLEDIDWQTRTIGIPQSKTQQRLSLPLTDEAGTALADYLQFARPRSPRREVFLRHRPPIGPLPVWCVGRSLAHAARVTGVNLSGVRFHGLRHAVALRLLRSGVGLKSISDVLGHRDPNTTAEYLRLDLDDLRGIALPVPHDSTASSPKVPTSALLPEPGTKRAPLHPAAKVVSPRRWQSFLKQSMQDYVARQRALGRACQREERILQRFDCFLANHYPHGRILTAAQFAAWSDRLHPSPTTKLSYLRCLRQFCVYLARTHADSFVPDPSSFPKPWPARLPCLIIPSQMARLLERTLVLNSRRYGHNPLRSQTLRLGLILLFCCGLRRGELLRLCLADFNLDHEVIQIRESKFHKSRVVPLSASVAEELRTYLCQRAQHRLPMEPTAPFLWNGRRGKSQGALKPSAIATQWHLTCTEAQAFDSRGRPPRLHDLHHSFAVEALRRGYAKGNGAQETLPRLARYMGHACLVFTHRYLKLTESIRQEASARFHHHVGRDVLSPESASSLEEVAV